MAFQFTPIGSEKQVISTPYFEDARADFAPFYATSKKPEQVQKEITQELAKLQGYGVRFVEGRFEEGKLRRWGYEVYFNFNGAPGKFRVAGLPMRHEDGKKRQRVLAQALCICREWVKSMVTTKVFIPGTVPLAQYLLVNPQGDTYTDFIMSRGKLPELSPKVDDDATEISKEVVES